MLPAHKLREYCSAINTVSQWWNPEEGPYRRFYSQQFHALEAMLQVKNGMKVLDLGTGQGRFARYFARKGCRVTAVDVSEEMLEKARSRCHAEGLDGSIEFQRCPAEEIDRLAGHFDVVSCMELIDHLADPGMVFRAAARQMRTGGGFVFSFCTAEAIQGRILRAVQRVERHPSLHLARPYHAAEVVTMLESAGLNLEGFVGMGLVNFVLRESASPILSRLLGWVGSIEGVFVPYYRAPGLVRYCTHNVGVARKR